MSANIDLGGGKIQWAGLLSNGVNALKPNSVYYVSQYIVSNFTYDNIFDMKTVISERKGNCYSAGQVMARVYQAMGYKATVRSAIYDKKSRYPSNMIMGSDHYNVEVIMNGRTYYLDATPGCGGVYLSSPKEVLESYIYSGNGWERIQ